MPDTRQARHLQPMDLLRKDHAALRGLFEQYRKTALGESQTRRDLFEKVNREFTLHAQIEEELFYPTVEAMGDDEAVDLIHQALEAHDEAKMLLEELYTLDPEGREFDATMRELAEKVEHHAREEEQKIFPKAAEMSRERLHHLMMDMDALKRSLEDDTL